MSTETPTEAAEEPEEVKDVIYEGLKEAYLQGWNDCLAEVTRRGAAPEEPGEWPLLGFTTGGSRIKHI